MKIGLTILTCCTNNDSRIANRLWNCLHSLGVNRDKNVQLFVVDDGGDRSKNVIGHDKAIRSYDATLITRPHGGISRAKNTCLRVLMESGCDIGFIAEDDIEFLCGWLPWYVDAIQSTGIGHFSWSWDHDPSEQWRCVRRVNGHAIYETSRVNGSFLAFTREAVEKVGGFPILPAPWGHEHTNWTKRMIAAGVCPYFCDIKNSNDYIRMNPNYRHSVVSDEQKREYAAQNEFCIHDLGPIHQPIEE